MCYEVSERRVCGVLGLLRNTCRYKSVADEQAALRIRLRDLAYSRASYGYRRLHILLRREGWAVNHKRVYRLYKQEGLMMRPKKPRRHVTACRRIERMEARGPNDGWSMDFMSVIVNAELATKCEDSDRFISKFTPVTDEMVERLEGLINEYEAKIELPRSFIIPGSNLASGWLDLSRAIVRRAERKVVALKESGEIKNNVVLHYLNRLADLLFILARYEET